MPDARLAIVLALAAGAAIAAQQPAGPVTGTAVISGRVTDGITGRPIAGAEIKLLREPYIPSLPSATSDAGGAFTIGELPPGQYRIWSTKGGYLEGGYGKRRPGGAGASLTLAEGERIENVVVVSWREAAIAGSVVDERGVPVAGAVVQVVERRVWDDEFRYAAGASGTTDDRGAYRIPRLEPGDYVVVAPSTSDSRVVAAAPPQRHVMTGRDREAFVSGVDRLSYLMGEDGRTALLLRGPVPPGADRQGRPRAFVTAVAGGVSVRTAHVVTLAAGDTRDHVDVQLRVSRAARVSGRVVGPAGPVSGSVIRLIPEGWDGPPYLARFTANAAADGAFAFLLVPSGNYRLEAERRVPPLSDVRIDAAGAVSVPMDDVLGLDSEHLWARTAIAVGEEDITDLDLVLRTGVRISGTLAFDSTSTPSAALVGQMALTFRRLGGEIFGSLSAGYMRSTASGRYTVLVAPGRYAIEGGRSPAPGWHFKTATLNGREIGVGPLDIGMEDVTDLVLTLTDRPAELHGTVAAESGGQILNAVVAVFSTDRSSWIHEPGTELLMPWRLGTRHVAGGAYRFAALPAGEYFVIAMDDADMERWPAPAMLEELSAKATRVILADGERRVMNLRVRR